MIELTTDPDHRVLCGSSLAPMDLPDLQVDCLITDPPYSARTHSGHDSSRRRNPHAMRDPGKCPQRDLNYALWSEADVVLACDIWAPAVKGWVVVITDHTLAPHWEKSLERHGRYVFAPLPFLSPGSRIRLAGDGPSSWTTWIIVARPRHRPYSDWGTLPGGYNFRPERMPVVGGKPLSLMRALVRDYSREGDLVWDPCCGGGTTLVAAKELGRRSIGMDLDRAHCEIAADRLSKANQTTIKFPAKAPGVQEDLL